MPFIYSPHDDPIAQATQAVASLKPKGQLFRLWPEFVIAAVALVTIAAMLVSRVLPHEAVARRFIPSDAPITRDDVKLLAVPLHTPFDSLASVKALTAAQAIQRGQPLRTYALKGQWAVARDTIRPGEQITTELIDYRPGNYAEDGFRDNSVIGRRAATLIVTGTTIRSWMLMEDRSAMIALRDVTPFKILTREDVSNAPTRSLAVVPIRTGSLVKASDLAVIAPQFDTIMSIMLTNSSIARTAPGCAVTLVVMTKGPGGQNICGDHLKVQVLQSKAAGEVIAAVSRKDHSKIIQATDLRAFQEIQ